MKKKIKKQWVEALRSGKYAQGKGQLKFVDEEETLYCCLGVLSELAIESGKIEGLRFDSSGFLTDEWDVNNGVVIPSVEKWAGLEEANPGITIDGTYVSLAEINDGLAPPFRGEPQDFNSIADIIEKYL